MGVCSRSFRLRSEENHDQDYVYVRQVIFWAVKMLVGYHRCSYLGIAIKRHLQPRLVCTTMELVLFFELNIRDIPTCCFPSDCGNKRTVDDIELLPSELQRNGIYRWSRVDNDKIEAP